MWFSDKIISVITSFNESKFIDEIILIDNNKKAALDISQFKKVRHIQPDDNLYVNPSWNIGISLCKNENVVISNDDLVVNNLDDVLIDSNIDEYDLIGLDYVNINKGIGLVFRKEISVMQKGFGCFLITKKSKYVNIPDEIKIWYGDSFLFNSIKNRAIFSCDNIDIKLSQTVLKIPDLHTIISNDRELFSKIKF